jgi:hypothetical protein
LYSGLQCYTKSVIKIKTSIKKFCFAGLCYPRLHLCNWLVDNVVNNVEFSQIIIFTDESWYHTSGYLNSQTIRIWSSENPHEIVEQAFYGKKIVVLAGFSQRRIIGPIFFQDYH